MQEKENTSEGGKEDRMKKKRKNNSKIEKRRTRGK
jgi:hypothetical protein